MTYLNNAATSWPKPHSTIADMQSFWHESPQLWKEKFEASHLAICDFFGIKEPEKFIVTSGATASLNLVFTDMNWQKGDIVVTSSFEHHALSGWELRLSEQYQADFKRIKSTEKDIFDLAEFESFVSNNHEKIKMVAFTHASNVTGDLMPMKEILEICREYRILSLLDAAQTGGIIEINIDQLKPDIFLFAGHKGTMGPHGIGGLYLSDNVVPNIPNAAHPGKKYVSFPTYCDMGSLNLEGMIALSSSLCYLKKIGFDEITRIKDNLNLYVYEKLDEMDEVEILSKSKLNRTYAIAFRTKNSSVEYIHSRLTAEDCIIGAGFFCSKSAHKELGTEKEGVLRISPGLFTTKLEIDQFFTTLKNIIAEK